MAGSHALFILVPIGYRSKTLTVDVPSIPNGDDQNTHDRLPVIVLVQCVDSTVIPDPQSPATMLTSQGFDIQGTGVTGFQSVLKL